MARINPQSAGLNPERAKENALAPETQSGLEDLLAVHRFHLQNLERHLGHKVPVPAEVAAAGPATLAASLDVLRRWLRLLDLGVSAPMIRDALKEAGQRPTAIALFRYYVLKASPADADRDKTDFLGAYLLKNPPPGQVRPPAPMAGESSTYSYHFSQKQAEEFQKELESLLGQPAAELPPQHAQLLREFQPLHQEADEFRHFDQIMDSGILQRVRELKGKFAASFYHPKVLAASAVYNVFFGRRFDELFREAAAQIKAFAAKVAEEGGSISSRVHGDVTVQNLAEVDTQILKAEYGRAREQFQKVSTMKKAVDTRRSGRGPRPAAASAAGATTPPQPTPGPTPAPTPAVQPLAESMARGSPAAAVEDAKVKGVVESIRNFVRAAEPGAASVVPVRNGNLVLTPAELEAFKADYAGEKSFRADYVNTLSRLVALHSRMQSEMDDYKAKRTSSYLWKPHADSLAYLMVAGKQALQEAAQIGVVADQRGLGEKAKAVRATMEKLGIQIGQVAQTLQS